MAFALRRLESLPVRLFLWLYAVGVGGGALIAPWLRSLSPEAAALRNWQIAVLAVALPAALLAGDRPPLDRALAPLVRARVLLPVLAAWMLVSEVLNFRAFRVNGIDFSLFDWMLEETLRGRFMYSPVYRVNHLGVHQTWWMLALVPLHALWRSPGLLLVANVAALAAAAGFVWRLAARVDPALAPLAAIAHATSPWTGRLLRDGFRPESLFPLCIFALADALAARRFRAVVAWGVALCLVKEDAPLHVLAFAGAAALLGAVPRPAGVGLLAAALAIFVLDTEVVRPAQLGPVLPGYTGFWAGYGSSVGEIAGTVLRHPLRAAADVLTARWWTVLLPALFLPLREPLAVAAMAPGLLMLGLASNPAMRRWEGYYPVAVACIALAGILCFAARYRGRPSAWLASVLALVLFPLFGNGYLRVHWVDPAARQGLAEVQDALGELRSPLCVQTAILPHLPYLDLVEPLDPTCRAKEGALLLVNPALPPYPDDAASLEALASRPGTRWFSGGFALVPERPGGR
jgi:Predicted membrane protein (DUF2079)